MKDTNSKFFVESISYRNLAELAEVCREQRTIGLCFGKPGTGKTTAAMRWANWSLVEANFSVRNGAPIQPEELLKCDTLYYLPSVTVSAPRLRKELVLLRNKFGDVIAQTVSFHRPADWAETIQKEHVQLIIVDEAYRMKYQALEELRDWHDKYNVGVLLIADPGFERNLGRMWHFQKRVAYVEEFKALNEIEVTAYIDKQVEQMKLPKPKDEVCALINWYCQGNLRSLGHLFAMIGRLLRINDDVVREVTRDVVETARDMLLFGLNGTLAKESAAAS